MDLAPKIIYFVCKKCTKAWMLDIPDLPFDVRYSRGSGVSSQ